MASPCSVCFIPCDNVCEHCKKTLHCCTEHQEQLYSEHKKICFPAIERESDEFGCHFVATRNIQPLEVIWEEKPLMMTPEGIMHDGEILPMCLGCCIILPGIFSEEFPFCSICKWPLCSKWCEDVEQHSQFECQIFQKENVSPLEFKKSKLMYECVKILRMIILKRRNSEKWGKIISLKSDIDLLRNNVGFKNVSSYLVDFIRNRCKINEKTKIIKQMYAISSRNSVKLCNDDAPFPGKLLASVMYEKRNKLLHSCLRNTVTISSYDRTKEVTYATSEIKEGEILYDFYSFDDMRMDFPGHVERRCKLFVSDGCWCKCAMCLDPTEEGTFYSAIKCNKETDGNICPGYFLPCVITDPKSIVEIVQGIWRCNFPECKAEEKYSHLTRIIHPIQKQIRALGFGSMVKKLTLLEQHENITLHENHFLLTQIRFSVLPDLLWNLGTMCEDPSMNNQKRLNAAEKLKTFSQKCLDIVDKFQPGLTLLRGVILFFLVRENCFRVKYNLPNVQPTEEMDKLRNEALSTLRLLPEQSYGNLLYEQLETGIFTNKIYINAFSQLILML